MGTPCDTPVMSDAPPHDAPHHIRSVSVMAGAMLEI